jgi:hypothetical protein
MIAQLMTAVMVAVAPIAVEASPPVKAEAARVEAAAVGLPPGRVIWRWYDPHTPGFLGMPIGPPCWGLVIQPRFSFKQYSECVPEMDWRNHSIGTWFGPSD